MRDTQRLGWCAGAGLLAFGLLLGLYFAVLTAVSGAAFARSQFAQYWPFVLALGAGFGVQVALFAALRGRHAPRDAGAVMAASGTTSTAAMVSCCAHYLASLAPVLGATGLVAFAARHQVDIFWAGIVLNAAGIAYVGSRLRKTSQDAAGRAHA